MLLSLDGDKSIGNALMQNPSLMTIDISRWIDSSLLVSHHQRQLQPAFQQDGMQHPIHLAYGQTASSMALGQAPIS